MSKFMFVVPPMIGHVNPTLGLGAELLRNGHEVAWVSFDPTLGERLPLGSKLLLIQSDMTEEKKENIKIKIEDIGKKASYGLDSLKFLYEDVLIPMNQGMLEGIEKLIDEFRPNVLINDHQIFAGAIAAIHKKIPYVTSVTAPAAIKINEELPMIHEWEGEQIVNFQIKNRIEGSLRLDCSSLLTLVYTSKYFFGKSNLPDQYKFIGPVINRNDDKIDFGWERFQSIRIRPKLLVSIGTTFDHSLKQQYFRKIKEAFEDEDLTVVVVSEPELFTDIPENFMIYKHVPQLQLIPYMDIIVCHGGHNTVCESLSNGKPLIITPIAYDQSYVAGCVVNSNAGIRLNFNRFKTQQMRDAVNTILSDKKYTDGAKMVQKSFAEAGGVSKAVIYLEEILNK